MKSLTLYLRSHSAEDVLDCLRSNEFVSGFTLSHCEGHSTSEHALQKQRTLDQVVGFVPRVRIEVILKPDQVEPVLANLRDCVAGGRLEGVWKVTDLEGFGRL